MYRIDENPVKKKRHHIFIIAGVALLAASLSYFGVRALSNLTTTKISPAPPAVSGTVTTPTAKTKTWDKPLFSISLPNDWVAEQQKDPHDKNIFTWHNTAESPGVQSMSVYMDTPQPTLGLNYVLSVEGSGDRLASVGDVSDNCASFTTVTAGYPKEMTPAKWNNHDFFCDLGNYLRHVAGTVSPDGINQVTLIGKKSGTHHIFFTYTDNNVNMDTTIFQNALQSFTLK